MHFLPVQMQRHFFCPGWCQPRHPALWPCPLLSRGWQLRGSYPEGGGGPGGRSGCGADSQTEGPHLTVKEAKRTTRVESGREAHRRRTEWDMSPRGHTTRAEQVSTCWTGHASRGGTGRKEEKERGAAAGKTQFRPDQDSTLLRDKSSAGSQQTLGLTDSATPEASPVAAWPEITHNSHTNHCI